MSRCPVNCKCGRHSLETREKLSRVGKGRVFTEEHRQRIGDGNRGKVHSDEQNRHQSETRKGVPLGPHTEEARRRHSDAAKLNVKTHFKVGNTPYMKGRTKETDPTAERFGFEYGINLAIIDKPHYLELEQQWRDAVPNWNARK